ncbi:Surface antigen BspA-like [Echinococcus multilocularis]|uniref:Surface antigen BspA-like n=1 Tax=Echinococcus multilocularis TaxID=6211 RepID=A0A0S4MLT0_ECHMU|nr:Surface antigen BspA-like [Echinococcus multilocularis]
MEEAAIASSSEDEATTAKVFCLSEKGPVDSVYSKTQQHEKTQITGRDGVGRRKIILIPAVILLQGREAFPSLFRYVKVIEGLPSGTSKIPHSMWTHCASLTLGNATHL